MPDLLTKPTTGSGTIVFDMETNGLLDDATQIHCMALHWIETGHTETFNDECPGKGLSSPILRGLQWLEVADVVIGHNIIGFDLPLAKRLYPCFNYPAHIIDTLLLSRLYHPNLYDIDDSRKIKNMPTNMYGRHSLESWGYRLNKYKGDFAKSTDWSQWSQEMEDYCVQDVMVTKRLCTHFRPYLDGSKWNTR